MVDEPVVEVQVLGRFQVRCGGAAVPVAPAQQRLVAFLALSGRPLARGYVAGTLWPDGSDRRAAANLRSAMWRLGPVGHALLEATPWGLGLTPGVEVDSRTLVRTAREVLSGDLPRAPLPGGDLLPGWDEPWVVAERERLRQIRAHALEAQGHRLLAAGDLAGALAAAGQALAVGPTRESAHRLLDVARAATRADHPVKAAQGA